jgi:hypothetical protein
MDYKNINKYDGEMSSSDLCDAIIEARTIDIPEVRDAAKMLVEDLRDSILNASNLYYLKNVVTNSPHINEHFSVFLFDDMYYAEKFVEKNSLVKFEIVSVKPDAYASMFSQLYDCGADGIDYCNDNGSVTFGIEHYFLSDDYNRNLCSARNLTRFILLCMQEIRNVDRQYERKDEIVMLLKKNIIAESLSAQVLIPVRSDGQNVDNQLVNVASGTQMNIATMNTPDNAVFFPVFTNVSEFNKNPIPGLRLAATSMISYIEFVYNLASNNESVFGFAINPNTVNFAMNKGIMEIIINNKKSNS